MDNDAAAAAGGVPPSNAVLGARGMQDLQPELLASVLRHVSGAGGLGGPLHFALVCRRFAAKRFHVASLHMREGHVRHTGLVLASELQVYQGPTTLKLSHFSVHGLRALWRGLSTQGPSLTAIQVGKQSDTCLQCEGECEHTTSRIRSPRDSQLCARHGQASAWWAFSGSVLRANPGLRSLRIQGHSHDPEQVSSDCHLCSLCFHSPDSPVSIPELRSSLSNLRRLTLKDVNLCWPQDWLSVLPPLNSLYLWNRYCQSDISRRDLDVILNMTSLTSLGLGLGWEPIRGGDFERLTNLRSLSLGLRRFGYEYRDDLVPASIWALTGLTRLWLDNPGLVPEEGLGRLEGLKVLELVGFHLKSLPSSLRALESAKFTRVHRLESVGECTSLRSLELVDLKPDSLPADMGQLACLTELKLKWLENVEELPDGFGRLTGLKRLSIRNCFRLKRLPADFGEPAALVDLHLHDLPGLEELPLGFGRLTGLKMLSIILCPRLKELPADFGQLVSLTYLGLQRLTKLEELPHCFGGLTGLMTLNIIDCPRLKGLPADLGQLTSLTDLRLENVFVLEDLPHGFGRLEALRNLKIEECPGLRNLPDDFSGLTSLTEESWKSVRALERPLDVVATGNGVAML